MSGLRERRKQDTWLQEAIEQDSKAIQCVNEVEYIVRDEDGYRAKNKWF